MSGVIGIKEGVANLHKRSDGEIKWLNYPLKPHGGGVKVVQIKGCTPIFSPLWKWGLNEDGGRKETVTIISL